MTAKSKRQVRFTKAPTNLKVKEGGRVVVSEAFVKQGATNLVPKMHVKRGDMVMLISGPKKNDKKRKPEHTRRLQERNAFKGTIGKVLSVQPKEGKVVVEGVNMVTHFVRPKAGAAESGIVRKEEPLFASKVMLYDPEKKRPIRGDKRKAANL
ncbi:MAG: 50S ribosomal protein L24 [Candidatus Obscuribacterales bacterium]|nr:50S ribosomal protein L24 [Candidatus Obscuribacterales bacterium]